MIEKHLANHLRERPTSLKEAKEKGVKVIGYFPGNREQNLQGPAEVFLQGLWDFS